MGSIHSRRTDTVPCLSRLLAMHVYVKLISAPPSCVAIRCLMLVVSVLCIRPVPNLGRLILRRLRHNVPINGSVLVKSLGARSALPSTRTIDLIFVRRP